MKKMLANQNNATIRHCAFCRYWYDPVNSAISPKMGAGMWEFDPEIQNKCLKYNAKKTAIATCSRFELKL